MEQPQAIIQPLSADQQQQVITETQRYIGQAIQLFGVKNTPVEIIFNLKGRAAGMYRIKRNIFRHKREIRYNPYIFSKYFDDNLTDKS